MSKLLRFFNYFVFWVVWVVVCGGEVACQRDNKLPCERFAQKYIRCMQASYDSTVALQQKMPPAEAKRSQPLLDKLKKRLQSGQWENEYQKRCLKEPPSLRVLHCIEASACGQLSRCYQGVGLPFQGRQAPLQR